MIYTLQNDFHGSSVRVRAEGLQTLPLDDFQPEETTVYLSRGQIARAKRALCGISGCTCSGAAGTRGPQVSPTGCRLVVDDSSLYVG